MNIAPYNFVQETTIKKVLLFVLVLLVPIFSSKVQLDHIILFLVLKRTLKYSYGSCTHV